MIFMPGRWNKFLRVGKKYAVVNAGRTIIGTYMGEEKVPGSACFGGGNYFSFQEEGKAHSTRVSIHSCVAPRHSQFMTDCPESLLAYKDEQVKLLQTFVAELGNHLDMDISVFHAPRSK